MIVDSVRVLNFRSIQDETLDCESLTVLVGANGTGKSSFLRALDLFYSTAPKVEADDFYDGDTSQEIVVAVTFMELAAEELERFGTHMQDNKLTVERVVCWNDGRPTYKLHGASLQCPEFASVRAAMAVKDRGKSAKEVYSSVKAKPEFASLPDWPGAGQVAETLRQWESANPDNCVYARDDGQFFGFTEVAEGYLGQHTRYLLIPAVRDAATDAAEGRGSVLSTLMDLVVRSVLVKSEALKQLQEDTQKRLDEIVAPDKLPELSSLADRLTGTLRTFAPDASVVLRWLSAGGVDLPVPKADARLVEDGYESTVQRTGHGLQRAFVLTMLQHLAAAQNPAQTTNVDAEAAAPRSHTPNLVLAIEEPELYQHPSRQRHLAKVLNQLASGGIPGVVDKTQVLYSTHSPLLVGIDRINQVRLLRKHEAQSGRPKVTRVVFTTLDKVAEEIWRADGGTGDRYTAATIEPRLRSVMTPWMNEGFFAGVVVLVEGEDDRAAVLGVAGSMGFDLESEGIAVIPCCGKLSLNRPLVMFRQLGIPTYLVWDSDKGKDDARPEDNRRLLRLQGREVEDWPSGVFDNCACFPANLETTMQEELGKDYFDQWLGECQDEFGIPKRKHALKNPAVVAALVQKAGQCSRSCSTITRIVEAARKLRGA